MTDLVASLQIQLSNVSVPSHFDDSPCTPTSSRLTRVSPTAYHTCCRRRHPLYADRTFQAYACSPLLCKDCSEVTSRHLSRHESVQSDSQCASSAALGYYTRMQAHCDARSPRNGGTRVDQLTLLSVSCLVTLVLHLYLHQFVNNLRYSNVPC